MSNRAEALAGEFRGYKTNCYLGAGLAGATVLYTVLQTSRLPTDLMAILTVLAGGLFIGARHFGRRSLEWSEVAESDRQRAEKAANRAA